MGVSVYVMPLETWLAGNFRATWIEGAEPDATPRARRSGEEARRLLETFQEKLEGLLAFRPDWDESGPARTATIFSLDGFSLPFLQARQWAYRLKLPLLCAMELPQIWIPVDFEPVLHVAAPWSPETEIDVVSSVRLQSELDRLQEELGKDPEREDLREASFAAHRLGVIASVSVEHRVPVIVEG